MKIVKDRHNKKAAFKLAVELINKKGQVPNDEEKAELEVIFIKRFDLIYKIEKKNLMRAVNTHSASSVLNASEILNKLCAYFQSSVWAFYVGRKKLGGAPENKNAKEIYDEQKRALRSLGETLAILLVVGEYVLTSPYGLPLMREDFIPQRQNTKDAIKTFAESCLQEDLKLNTKPIKKRFEYFAMELAANFGRFKRKGLIDPPMKYYKNQVIAEIKEFASFF